AQGRVTNQEESGSQPEQEGEQSSPNATVAPEQGHQAEPVRVFRRTGTGTVTIEPGLDVTATALQSAIQQMGFMPCEISLQADKSWRITFPTRRAAAAALAEMGSCEIGGRKLTCGDMSSDHQCHSDDKQGRAGLLDHTQVDKRDNQMTTSAAAAAGPDGASQISAFPPMKRASTGNIRSATLAGPGATTVTAEKDWLRDRPGRLSAAATTAGTVDDALKPFGPSGTLPAPTSSPTTEQPAPARPPKLRLDSSPADTTWVPAAAPRNCSEQPDSTVRPLGLLAAACAAQTRPLEGGLYGPPDAQPAKTLPLASLDGAGDGRAQSPPAPPCKSRRRKTLVEVIFDREREARQQMQQTTDLSRPQKQEFAPQGGSDVPSVSAFDLSEHLHPAPCLGSPPGTSLLDSSGSARVEAIRADLARGAPSSSRQTHPPTPLPVVQDRTQLYYSLGRGDLVVGECVHKLLEMGYPEPAAGPYASLRTVAEAAEGNVAVAVDLLDAAATDGGGGGGGDELKRGERQRRPYAI
ncbi:hypothetical protein KEM52_000729, partial [Ascosphaera acerosa]